MSINNKIKQYGLKNSLKRGIKSFLRILNVRYDSFWYMTCNINVGELKQKMEEYDYSDVKELSLADFHKGDLSYINEAKLNQIESRLKSNNHWAYGILEDNKLIYSTWVSRSKVNENINTPISIPLKPNQALLEDSYCHPKFRGLGLHSKMNLFRIKKIHDMGRSEVIAIVVSENTPAIKTQIKSGFNKLKKVSFLTIFGRQFQFEKKVK